MLYSKALRKKGSMSVNLGESKITATDELKQEKQPIIFIAHSLGGLILQAFLPRCSFPLRASIKGIMFFGSPGFGLHEKKWIAFAAAMSDIDSALGNKSMSHISGETYMSQLGFISDNFKEWLPHQIFARKIICFYEISPILDNVIVS